MGESVTQQLQARLGVARLLISEAAGDPLQAQTISSSQAAAVAQLVTRLPVMDAVARADLCAAVMRTGFMDKDKQMVHQLLMDRRRTSKTGWQMQNYEAITEYFSEREWTDVLLKDSVASPVKLRLIIDRLHNLQCERPSESTIKRICIMHVLVSDGMEKAMLLNGETVKLMMQQIRQDIKRNKKGHPENEFPVDVAMLPPSYTDFFGGSASMGLARQIYGADNHPVPCKIDRAMMAKCEVSFRCRGVERASSHLSLKSTAVPDITNSVQLREMGSMFMGGMEKMQHAQMQMQQQQLQFMQMVVQGGMQRNPAATSSMLGGHSSASAPMLQFMGGNIAGSAGGLIARRDQPTFRSPSMDGLVVFRDQSSQQPTLEEVDSQDQVVDEGMPKQPEAKVPALENASQRIPLQSPPAADKLSAGALSTTSMLDLLEKRDAAAKEAAKLRKAKDKAAKKAAAAAESTPEPPAAEKPQKKKKKKKSRKLAALAELREKDVAALPMKAAPPAKVMASATAKKVAKADGKAKAKAAAGKAKAKAKAPAGKRTSRAAYAEGPDPRTGLGCSKCRYSHKH